MDRTLIKYTVFKYTGLALSVVFGLIQPSLFDRRLNQEDFAFIILLYGFASYLIFCDFGISKPIYADIRKRFIKGEDWNTPVKNVLPLYNFILVIIILIFLPATATAWSSYPNTFPFTMVLLFCLTITLNIGLNYLENIMNAIGELNVFQFFDISRKIVNLATLFLILLDGSMQLSFITSATLLLILYMSLLNRLNKKTAHLKTTVSAKVNAKILVKRYWGSSKDALIFNVNEVIIYNNGYLIIPAFLGPFFIVQLGLWSKLFLGITLFSSGISLVLIHKITENYFSGNIELARKTFFQSIFASLAMSLSLFAGIVIFKKMLFKYWVSPQYEFSGLYMATLGIWAGINSIQTVSGTFLLTTAKHYRKLRNISSIMVILIITTTITALKLGAKLDMAIFLAGIAYLLGAGLYFFTATHELRTPTKWSTNPT